VLSDWVFEAAQEADGVDEPIGQLLASRGVAVQTTTKASAVPARDLAVQVLERVRSGRFAEHALSEALTRTSLRQEERALATELVYGVVRWQRRLDAIIDRCTEGSGKRVKPAVRDILRVALYQLILLEKVPAHAAVNEAVNQVRRRFAAGPAGFVNAVLRNALRNLTAVDPAPTDDPASLAMHFSHPDWLVNRWLSEIGLEATRRVLAHNNARASVDLRVNTLKTTNQEFGEILRQAGYSGAWSAFAPHAIRLEAVHGPIQSLPGYRNGLFAVQDVASQMIAALLKAEPGHRILDACAAPGGKTAHLAALTGNKAGLVAVDCDAIRLEETRENLQRLGIEGLELRAGDSRALEFVKSLGTFDRILLDAPCTGLGVLRHNPEAKYRLLEEELAAFGARQLRLLRTVAQVLNPGGLLVYSVCTVSREETSDVIEGFLDAQPHFSLEALDPAELPLAGLTTPRGYFSTFPPPVGEPMDGFFAARIRRDR